MSIPARVAVAVVLLGVVGSMHGARAGAAASPPFTPTAVTFEGPLARSLPDVGRSLVTGDFDGDGTLDAAALVPGAVATVLNVSGSAEAAVVTPLPAVAARYPVGSGAADMDGDGFPDLVLAGSGESGVCEVTVLRGLGDGSFELGSSARLAPIEDSWMSCWAMAVADVDDDGNPDVAVLYSYSPPDTSNGLNGVVDILLGSGTGALGWASRYELTEPGEQPFMAFGLAVSDFDGDGTLDLAVGAEVRWVSGPTRWRVQTLLGDATGMFERGPKLEFTAWALDLTNVQAGDANGDGRSDLFFGTTLATGVDVGYELPVLAFFNEGDASFSGPVEVAREVAIRELALADYTLGGVNDLLIAGGDDRVTLLPGEGLGAFAPPERFFVSGGVSGALAADVDDDGGSDLLLLDAQGQLLVAAGSKRARPLALPALTRPPDDAQNVLPTLVDLDGDGLLDVLAATAGRVDVLLGTGAGRFTAGTSVATSAYPWRAPVLDLNGDGLFDLVVVDGAGFSTVFGVDGGSFAPWSPPAGGLRDISASAWGDVDADGDVDLVVAEYAVGAVELHLNDGTGRFTLAHRLATSAAVNDLALGDFDRDGRLDLLVGSGAACIVVADSCLSGPTLIWFGDGAGNFERSSTIDVRANRILTVDVTGDGLLDLLAPGALFIGRGDGTFAPPRPLPDAAARDLVLADLNGDGHLDLLWTTDAGAYVAAGDGTGNFAERRFVARLDSSASLAIGDLTGSALPDLLVSRPSNIDDVYEVSELIVLGNTTAVACQRR